MPCRTGGRNDGVLICIDMMQLNFRYHRRMNLSRKKVRNGAEFGKNPEMRDRDAALQERKLSILFAFGQWIGIDEVLRLYRLYGKAQGSIW